MNERDLEKLVKKMADQHNIPPAVPREKMWRNIQAHQIRSSKTNRSGYWQATLAVAAILIIGIGIGRWIQPIPNAGTLDQTDLTPVTSPDLYQQPVLALFDRAEIRLTEFRIDERPAQDLDPAGNWATEMLLQTRILQGSAAGQSPELGPMLMDLELVLAQIVGINPVNPDRDVAWIRSGLNHRETLDNLRAAQDRPL